MSKILQEYPSSSNPAKKYNIIEPSGGGEAYCDCPGWRFNKDSPRSCKHLKMYHSNQVPEVPADEPIDSPSDEDDEIENAINMVMK